MTATEFKRTEEDMLDYLDNAAIGLHWVDGNAMVTGQVFVGVPG
jgi:hypothetical protein